MQTTYFVNQFTLDGFMNTGTSVLLMSLTAVLVPLISNRFGESLGPESLWIPAILAFLIGIIACWLAPNELAPPLLALLIFVPLGIFADVMVDWFVFARERNLFPIEVAIWEIVLFVPGALGVLVCRIVLASKHAPDDKAI